MGFHRIRIWLLVTALALGIALPAGAQLMPEEKDALKEALFIGNITEDELKYERVQFKDPFRMRIIDEVLNQPIETADKLMALHNVAKKSMSDLIRVGRDQIIKNSLQAEVDAPGGSMFPALPESIRASVGILVGGLAQAQVDVQLALSNLTDDEQRDLIESLPVLAVEEPKVTFEFTRKPPLSRTQILALIRKVDLDKLLTAGLNLSTAVEKAMVGLRIAKADVPAPVKLKVNAVNIVVLGSGDDQFQGKGEDLVIDLGGNDQFTGRIGGGIGKTSVFIAIGGNDSFDLGDGSGGSGVLGIGIMRKVGGRDSFRGKSLCFGAGLCGVGGFAKEGGDDFYDAVSLSEGFAMFGVGACIDTSGNDHYTLGLHGQGDSRTQGVGWLVDRKGDDVYTAGGISLNSPLFKDIYYSWAQGSSSGYREDTGGVSGGLGMLTDLSGDDTYISQTYAQAASYWYSVGTLFDGNGHDTYTGYHYVQASAMHACGAFLFDLRGDDGYLTKFGASHSIGHDYGVAFLLDRKGNDIYAARDSTPGVGAANGVGIFLDCAGEDRYQGPPGRGNVSRGTGSVGIFVDMGGQDKYGTGLADAEAAVTNTWGVAYDHEDPFKGVASTDVGITQTPVPGSLVKPSDADMEQIYAKAIQWAVGTAQQESQENVRKLIQIGLPAVEWMLERKLKTADRLSNRTFVAVINGVGPDGRSALARKLLTAKDGNELRSGLSIAADGGMKEIGPLLARMIKTPSLQRQAVRAAGAIGALEAVVDLLPLCASADRNLAAAAMISLSQIGSEDAYSTAEAVLQQPNLLMRKAAQSLIAKFPIRAIETAKRLLGDSQEHLGRCGIEILGLVGSPEALKEVGTRLLDPSSGVRIQALLALADRCPSEFRQQFLYLRNDPIPSVKAVAHRLSP